MTWKCPRSPWKNPPFLSGKITDSGSPQEVASVSFSNKNTLVTVSYQCQRQQSAPVASYALRLPSFLLPENSESLETVKSSPRGQFLFSSAFTAGRRIAGCTKWSPTYFECVARRFLPTRGLCGSGVALGTSHMTRPTPCVTSKLINT